MSVRPWPASGCARSVGHCERARITQAWLCSTPLLITLFSQKKRLLNGNRTDDLQEVRLACYLLRYQQSLYHSITNHHHCRVGQRWSHIWYTFQWRVHRKCRECSRPRVSQCAPEGEATCPWTWTRVTAGGTGDEAASCLTSWTKTNGLTSASCSDAETYYSLWSYGL